MQLFLSTVNSCEDDDQGCFQGGADGQAFHKGHRPDHYNVGRQFRATMPGCSLCERVSRAFTWARSYTDRKEAKRVLQLSRYRHRRSAVVEVLMGVFTALIGGVAGIFFFFGGGDGMWREGKYLYA